MPPSVRPVVILTLTQLVDSLAGVAMTIPVGKKSTTLMVVVNAVPRELSILNVRVLVPPGVMLLGEKLLEKPGRSAATSRSALAAELLPIFDDDATPALFVCVPTVLLVTLTVMVQLELAPTLPPLKLMVPPPSGALRMPSQSEKALDGVAITTAAGRTSVNATSSAGGPGGLEMTNSRVVVLPGPMVLGLKDLENVNCV